MNLSVMMFLCEFADINFTLSVASSDISPVKGEIGRLCRERDCCGVLRFAMTSECVSVFEEDKSVAQKFFVLQKIFLCLWRDTYATASRATRTVPLKPRGLGTCARWVIFYRRF